MGVAIRERVGGPCSTLVCCNSNPGKPCLPTCVLLVAVYYLSVSLAFFQKIGVGTPVNWYISKKCQEPYSAWMGCLATCYDWFAIPRPTAARSKNPTKTAKSYKDCTAVAGESVFQVSTLVPNRTVVVLDAHLYSFHHSC